MMIIAASLAAAGFMLAAPVAAAIDASNPFAKESTLPFNYPAFDKIDNAHYKFSLRRGHAHPGRRNRGHRQQSQAGHVPRTPSSRWSARAVC
ncbi:hypothetical protein LP420_21605 [Massilia sp. B-10]|nr:hypothetical protein LP420_21605 [Massilia sp. B-10]